MPSDKDQICACAKFSVYTLSIFKLIGLHHMKAFHRLALVLVLVFCATGLHAEDWNTGTLLNYGNHQDTTLYEGTRSNAGISCYLQVDVGDRIYFVHHRVGYIWEHLPQLTENS